MSTIAMITPNPAADAVRRRGLRRMRTLAVSLLLLAAAVYVLTLLASWVLAGRPVGAETDVLTLLRRAVR